MVPQGLALNAKKSRFIDYLIYYPAEIGKFEQEISFNVTPKNSCYDYL